jgi:hypothetical protein
MSTKLYQLNILHPAHNVSLNVGIVLNPNPYLSGLDPHPENGPHKSKGKLLTAGNSHWYSGGFLFQLRSPFCMCKKKQMDFLIQKMYVPYFLNFLFMSGFGYKI